MTTTVLVLGLLSACSPCPDGLERRDGHCLPEGGADRGPLSEPEFRSLYERRGCQELEECLEELCASEPCEIDLDCDPVDWSDVAGCTFDLGTAETCLNERWDCDESAATVWAPSSCAEVYDCE
jgi:hypothetical protein